MAILATFSADELQPFTLENAAVRGRVVRLGGAIDAILGRHAYPDDVSRLLGEAMCVASILAANLKYTGIITIQMKGNGPVRLLVVDAAAERYNESDQLEAIALRGYAELKDGEPLPAEPTPRALMGDESYLAITYDPGRGMQRYQGVVALEGKTLSESLSAYFTQSQQLDVVFKLAVDKLGEGWVAGGLMIERIASEGGAEQGADTHEAWQEALAYVGTVKPEELLDPELPLSDLLFRLFHEAGVRVTAPVALLDKCRCSRPRIQELLLSMPVEERADMVLDGAVSVHCQFCNTTERFTPKEIELPFNQ